MSRVGKPKGTKYRTRQIRKLGQQEDNPGLNRELSGKMIKYEAEKHFRINCGSASLPNEKPRLVLL